MKEEEIKRDAEGHRIPEAPEGTFVINIGGAAAEELSNNYNFKTTFWSDFTIAEAFGADAIIDTFNRAFEEWKSDYIYLTELVLVLNWKLWNWYEKGEDAIAKIYDALWREADAFAYDNLQGEELEYFMKETD